MTPRRGSELSVLEIMIVKVHILMSQHVLFGSSLFFSVQARYIIKRKEDKY